MGLVQSRGAFNGSPVTSMSCWQVFALSSILAMVGGHRYSSSQNAPSPCVETRPVGRGYKDGCAVENPCTCPLWAHAHRLLCANIGQGSPHALTPSLKAQGCCRRCGGGSALASAERGWGLRILGQGPGDSLIIYLRRFIFRVSVAGPWCPDMSLSYGTFEIGLCMGSVLD